MKLKLFNTLTQQKEEFTPIVPGKVGIYSCGPTVYNFAHLGNLRSYVFADILKRVLAANSYAVTQVMNITDVGHLSDDGDNGQDKIEKGAERENKTVWQIAEFYTKAFLHDIKLLNIGEPSILCRATDHIPEMIDLIEQLEKRGYTYQIGGNVYFDTSKSPKYGELARLKLDDATVSRVEQDKNKRSPRDFVLWFTKSKHKEQAMIWSSPWGEGFPGWHIECSAMASKYLGERFDIHTGGIDHVPVHHTNEIAQSESAFGHKWVNYWLHNEFLTTSSGDKMAKSGENFLTLASIVEQGFDPLDYRYYLLGGHYRTKLEFSTEAITGAHNARTRLKTKIAGMHKVNEVIDKNAIKEYYNVFLDHVNNDLNTAKGLATLWEIVDSNISDDTKLELIDKLDQILGLDLLADNKEKIPQEITLLVEKRVAARGKQDWTRADQIREQIEQLGYVVEDSSENINIRKK